MWTSPVGRSITARMPSTSARLALLAALAGTACIHSQAPTSTPAPVEPSAAPAATLVFRGVRLFDGERAREAVDVGVAGETIVAVGEVTAAAGAEIVDGAGLTLLPGLIDAHTHVQAADDLRRALVFGVTTELDMFTTPGVVTGLRRIGKTKAGAALADLRSAGILVTAPGGHGTEYGLEIPTIERPDQAAAFVDARLAEGSDYVKIVFDDGSGFGATIPTLTADTLRAVIAAAHARQRLAVVHVSSQREATAAIEAGADGLAHVFFDAAPTPEFVALAKRRGVFVIDTLPVIHALCGDRRGAALADAAELSALLTPEAARALKAAPGRPLAGACTHADAAVRALHAAGVPLIAGTDAPNPGTAHGASLHDALALLVAAGLTPTEALAAATSVPSDSFGLADRGRLAAGKRADLLLVRGDPTQDVTRTRAIVGVWKAGAPVDLAAARADVQQQRAAIAALRAAPPPTGAAAGLVADFEAGAVAASFGAGWVPSTDQMLGGRSQVALTIGAKGKGARRSEHALRISGEVVVGAPTQWAGAMFFPGAEPMQPANLGAFRRLSFWARADAPMSMTVMLFAQQLGQAPTRRTLEVGPRWTQHALDLESFADIEWYDVLGLLFGATAEGKFALEIDDVRFE